MTNRRLHKIIPSKVPTSNCTFCRSDIETVIHLFYECEVTKKFWSTLFQTWGIYFHCTNMVSARVILLGDPTLPELLNFVLLVAKRYIYISRCEEKTPTFVNFKSFIFNIQKTERYIAIRKSKLDKHIKKWGDMLQVLEES